MAESPRVNVRFPAEARESMERAATEQGVKLSEWIRDAANERLEREAVQLTSDVAVEGPGRPPSAAVVGDDIQERPGSSTASSEKRSYAPDPKGGK